MAQQTQPTCHLLSVDLGYFILFVIIDLDFGILACAFFLMQQRPQILPSGALSSMSRSMFSCSDAFVGLRL